MAGRSSGKLYVVATPIGNLGDLSPRAREVLGSVAIIAAEDTRVSGRLLARFEIKAKLASYHDANESARTPSLLKRLQEGDDVALISDAGTPCVSDPGYRLVKAAADAGIEVVSVPGPSAVTALLSVSGLPTDRFRFEGFLPSKSGARRAALGEWKGAGSTVVFYESAHRILACLADLADLLGDAPAALGRELTKMHEQVLRGSAAEIAEALKAGTVKGEFVVAVAIPAAEPVALSLQALEKLVRERLDAGTSVRDIAVELKDEGVDRRTVYEVARRLKSEGE